jgi:hypothetical protein
MTRTRYNNSIHATYRTTMGRLLSAQDWFRLYVPHFSVICFRPRPPLILSYSILIFRAAFLWRTNLPTTNIAVIIKRIIA